MPLAVAFHGDPFALPAKPITSLFKTDTKRDAAASQKELSASIGGVGVGWRPPVAKSNFSGLIVAEFQRKRAWHQSPIVGSNHVQHQHRHCLK